MAEQTNWQKARRYEHIHRMFWNSGIFQDGSPRRIEPERED
jgi:mannose-1-phosphate guanylyltransferase